jgi:hypothetical protein
MHRQLPEEPPERLLRLGGEVLVAEEDHAVLDEGVVDLLEGGLVQRPARSTPWISAPIWGVSFSTVRVSPRMRASRAERIIRSRRDLTRFEGPSATLARLNREDAHAPTDPISARPAGRLAALRAGRVRADPCAGTGPRVRQAGGHAPAHGLAMPEAVWTGDLDGMIAGARSGRWSRTARPSTSLTRGSLAASRTTRSRRSRTR